MRFVGPNSPGMISPGKAKLGFMPSFCYAPGPVGVISRSGESLAQMRVAHPRPSEADIRLLPLDEVLASLDQDEEKERYLSQRGRGLFHRNPPVETTPSCRGVAFFGGF